MAPFYRGYDPVFKLDSDDIQVSFIIVCFINHHIYSSYALNHL
jgi:matrix metalloproteinase-14 (membrane-inserted)